MRSLSLRLLQALLVVLILLAYVMAVYAVEQFNLLPLLSIPGLTVVVALLWFFISGRKLEETGEEARKYLYGRITTDHVFVGLVCLAASIVLLVAGLAVSLSETLVLIPVQEAEEVEVFKVDDGKEHQVGFASKDKPFRNRYFIGQKKFRFKAQDFQPRDLDVTVGGHLLFSEEKHHVIEMVAEPKFELANEGLSGDYEEPEDTNLPRHLQGRPSQVLRFTVTCPSPAAFEITGLRLEVGDVKPVKGWTFPYFGEALQTAAVVVKSYAELKHGQVEVDLPEVATVGARRGSATYSIRLVGESARSYPISRVGFYWVDVNQPDHKGWADIPLKSTPAVQFRQDWTSLLREAPGPVRILYNAPVDRLQPLLKSVPAYTILIADPRADEYLRAIGHNPEKKVVVLLRDLQQKMEEVAGKTKTEPPRACSFIAVDDDRVLLQDAKVRDEGVLLDDKDRRQKIIAAYDAAAAKAIPK